MVKHNNDKKKQMMGLHGRFVARFVEPGSVVSEFDKICEVQSDKASVEITSRFAGKIKTLHYKVNEIAKVGQPLVDIEVEDDVVAGSPTAENDKPSSTPEPEQKKVKQEPTQSGRPLKDPSILSLATPAVRRIAKENNVDITQIKGTGKDGRVLKEDVMAYISGKCTTTVPLSCIVLVQVIE